MCVCEWDEWVGGWVGVGALRCVEVRSGRGRALLLPRRRRGPPRVRARAYAYAFPVWTARSACANRYASRDCGRRYFYFGDAGELQVRMALCISPCAREWRGASPHGVREWPGAFPHRWREWPGAFPQSLARPQLLDGDAISALCSVFLRDQARARCADAFPVWYARSTYEFPHAREQLGELGLLGAGGVRVGVVQVRACRYAFPDAVPIRLMHIRVAPRA